MGRKHLLFTVLPLGCGAKPAGKSQSRVLRECGAGKLTASIVQELRSSGGALVASGVSAEVGNWGAVARLQGDQEALVSTSSFQAPQFHKMHDYATEAIKMRYMSLRQQGRAHEFDGSMKRVDMQDSNVALLQVCVAMQCWVSIAVLCAYLSTCGHVVVLRIVFLCQRTHQPCCCRLCRRSQPDCRSAVICEDSHTTCKLT